MSLGGDFALSRLNLKLAEAWQGDSVTRSSAQHAGEEGLPFPTPLQRWRPVPCKMSPSFSMTVPGSVQAQEEVTPSSSPSGSPNIAVCRVDDSGSGWCPPALQLC